LDTDQPLQGQVAIVTGGASGIGRATVLALAAEGVRTAILDANGDGAEQVAKEAGSEAKAFVLDVRDVDAVVDVVDAVLAHFGRIDILVNSAGTTGTIHNVLDFTDDTYELVMNVNLRAPFWFIRAVGRHLIERGGGGRIVNLSSSASARATAAPAVYAASKSGINGLTRAAAGDLGPFNVNVNAVAPGLTKTPMTAGIGDDETYQQLVESGPIANLLKRVAEPEDVAGVIVFLCRPESRQITGQVIHASGGLVI
jgi:NAD(P)-dependent dehydrogenase (short-subunit alcohol dehydrogenase family)